MMCNMLLHVPSPHIPGSILIPQKQTFLVRPPSGNLNHNIHFIKFFITFNFMFSTSGDTQECCGNNTLHIILTQSVYIIATLIYI